MANKPPNTEPSRETEVISAGAGRTGSYSMALALRILGYQNVFHCCDELDNPEKWAIINRACDATFPVLPTYTGVPFTRSQWDELLGSCDAITDLAGTFATQLIEAYPNAKIILSHRETEAWYNSVDKTLLPMISGPVVFVFMRYIEPLCGSAIGATGRKMLLGWAGVRTTEEFRQVARKVYARHAAEVNRLVPEERLLNYRLGDGWEPLCQFLGKPVPDVPFPHANEREVMKRRMVRKQWHFLRGAVVRLGPYVVVLIALLIAGRMVLPVGEPRTRSTV